MSAAGATAAPLRRASGASSPIPAPRPPRETARPRSRAQLSVVAPGAPVAGRTPFAVLVGGILLAGLMSLLLVHTLAAQDAFRVHDLNQRLASLKDTEQQLAVSAQQAASPTALRARAEALGMRPSQVDGYRHAKDGRVVGTLTAIPLPVIAAPPTPTATTAAGHTPRHRPSTKPAHQASSAPGTAAAGTKAGATAGTKAGTTAAKRHATHHAEGRTGASHR
jgi:outer membrane murein-binding lipoprotein Lpp